MKKTIHLVLFVVITACLAACGGGGGSDSSHDSFAGNWKYTDSSSSYTIKISSSDNINYTGTVTIINYGVGVNIQANISGQFPQTIPTAGHTIKFVPTITNIVSYGQSIYEDKFYISFSSMEVPYNQTQSFNLYSELQILVKAEGWSFYMAPSWFTLSRT